MSEQLPSAFRTNLPLAFVACNCNECSQVRIQSAKQNAIAPFRLRRKKPGVGPRFIVDIKDEVCDHHIIPAATDQVLDPLQSSKRKVQLHT